MKQSITRFSTPIKRCLRVDDGFVCGICKSFFHNRFEALNCLDRCFLTSSQEQSCREVKQFGKVRFKCSVCQRRYEEASDATHCLSVCLQKQKSHARKIARLRSDELINDTNKLKILESQLGRSALMSACKDLLSEKEFYLVGSQVRQITMPKEGARQSSNSGASVKSIEAVPKRQLWTGN